MRNPWKKLLSGVGALSLTIRTHSRKREVSLLSARIAETMMILPSSHVTISMSQRDEYRWLMDMVIPRNLKFVQEPAVDIHLCARFKVPLLYPGAKLPPPRILLALADNSSGNC